MNQSEQLVVECAICLTRTANPQFDHDHATGKARDWLCRHCNLGLGHFKDNAGALYRAAMYIEQHQSIASGYERHNPNDFHRLHAAKAHRRRKQIAKS